MRRSLLASCALFASSLPGCGPNTGGQSGAELVKGEPPPPARPSEPGDPGASEDCEPAACEDRAQGIVDTLVEPLPAPADFTASNCAAMSVVGKRTVSGTVCECQGPDGDRVLGPVGLGCYEFGRSGECLFDDSEFSGCSADNPQTCQDACAQLQQRRLADAASTVDAQVAYAGCIDKQCHYVIKVAGECFADGSLEVGRAYDCEGTPQELVSSEAQAQDPLSGLSEVPTNSGPYVEGTSGFVELSVGESFTGTFSTGPYFGAYAQFFHTTGSESFEFGEVLDPLQAVDDCGRTASSGTGATNVETDWFAVDKAELLDGERRFPFEEWVGNVDFFTYSVGLTDLGVEPRFRQRYGLYVEGAELNAPIEVDDILLPEALSFPELQQLAHMPRGDLELRWTGRGDAPLDVILWVTASVGASLGPFELRCRVQDDGQFTLTQELFDAAPDGIVSANFYRANRFVDRSGEQSLLTIGRAETRHAFALGEECDNQAVLEACHAYAEHYVTESTECGGTYVQPLAEACPEYLATSCVYCVEYFDCMRETVSCEDNMFDTNACSCAG